MGPTASRPTLRSSFSTPRNDAESFEKTCVLQCRRSIGSALTRLPPAHRGRRGPADCGHLTLAQPCFQPNAASTAIPCGPSAHRDSQRIRLAKLSHVPIVTSLLTGDCRSCATKFAASDLEDPVQRDTPVGSMTSICQVVTIRRCHRRPTCWASSSPGVRPGPYLGTSRTRSMMFVFLGISRSRLKSSTVAPRARSWCSRSAAAARRSRPRNYANFACRTISPRPRHGEPCRCHSSPMARSHLNP